MINECKSKIDPFLASPQSISNSCGYIVWRVGTGRNVELLHLKAIPGHGKKFLSDMLRELKDNPPYATVFGFTRTCNQVAQQFYIKRGFILTPVTGVYADGNAVLFSQTFSKLWELNCA